MVQHKKITRLDSWDGTRHCFHDKMMSPCLDLRSYHFCDSCVPPSLLCELGGLPMMQTERFVSHGNLGTGTQGTTSSNILIHLIMRQ